MFVPILRLLHAQVPDRGMLHFEVLSRASAFVARCPAGNRALLASRHVTHPQLYVDSYYNDKPWLQFVQSEHLRYSVEAYKVCLLRLQLLGVASLALPHFAYMFYCM